LVGRVLAIKGELNKGELNKGESTTSVDIQEAKQDGGPNKRRKCRVRLDSLKYDVEVIAVDREDADKYEEGELINDYQGTIVAVSLNL
jgi:hypothetical protein